MEFICNTGQQAKELRRFLKQSQGEFWGRYGLSQSTGCRYELGRQLPLWVQQLIHLTHTTEHEAARYLAELRRPQTGS